MKRTRFYLALLASLCVLLIPACTKGRDAFEYYFLFESYFVPRGVNENSLISWYLFDKLDYTPIQLYYGG